MLCFSVAHAADVVVGNFKYQSISWNGSGNDLIGAFTTIPWTWENYTNVVPYAGNTSACDFAYTTLSNKMYVFGGGQNLGVAGRTNSFVFDGATWSEIVGLPSVDSTMGCAAGVLNGKIYVIGGSYMSMASYTNTYAFDGSSWSVVNGLPGSSQPGRMGHACVNYSNVLYVIGGTYAVNSISAKTNVYTFDGTNWSAIAGMPAARAYGKAVIFSNSIYYFGGTQTTGARTNVFRFDGSTWTEARGLPASAIRHSAVVAGNYVYIIGFGSGYTNCYKFDGTSYQSVVGLPSYRYYHGSALIGDSIYVVSGFAAAFPTNTVFKTSSSFLP
jgi:N-acetylneuraminic acid mutarotase